MQLALLWARGWIGHLLSSCLAWIIQWSYDAMSTLCIWTMSLTCWVRRLLQYVPKFHLKNKMVLFKFTSMCFLKEGEACTTVHTDRLAVKVWVLISFIFVTKFYFLSSWQVHVIVMKYNFIRLVRWVLWWFWGCFFFWLEGSHPPPNNSRGLKDFCCNFCELA